MLWQVFMTVLRKNVDFITNLTEFVSTLDIICQYNLALLMFFRFGKNPQKEQVAI